MTNEQTHCVECGKVLNDPKNRGDPDVDGEWVCNDLSCREIHDTEMTSGPGSERARTRQVTRRSERPLLGGTRNEAAAARRAYMDGEIDEEQLEKRLDSEEVIRNDRDYGPPKNTLPKLLLMAAVGLGLFLLLATAEGSVPI
jgi:hypothetical protein